MTGILISTVGRKKAVEFDVAKEKKISRMAVFVIVYSVVLFGLVVVLMEQLYSNDNQDTNSIVGQEGNGIVFGRHRFVDAYKMVPPVEAEAPNPPNALSDEFINDVNSRAFVWEAGRNFAEDTPMTYIKKLMGVKKDRSMRMKVVAKMLKVHKPKLVGGKSFPTEFDARTKWQRCKSISEIRDQGGCGSCWAFGATETMTDRQCIHKRETFHYSAEDLVSCCETCGDGCDGGDPMSAFVHWMTDGIVSGGAYGSHQGCSPYEIQPCEHHVSGNRGLCIVGIKTPACRKQCDASYNTTYVQDLRFAKTVYTLSNEGEILRELVKNGPMEGSFDVYEDFLHYKSGVYHHVTGSLLGGHAIRVLGFGVEGGVPYYLCANSWNYDWGNGGFFKIRRDQMHKDMVAGIPA